MVLNPNKFDLGCRNHYVHLVTQSVSVLRNHSALHRSLAAQIEGVIIWHHSIGANAFLAGYLTRRANPAWCEVYTFKCNAFDYGKKKDTHPFCFILLPWQLVYILAVCYDSSADGQTTFP